MTPDKVRDFVLNSNASPDMKKFIYALSKIVDIAEVGLTSSPNSVERLIHENFIGDVGIFIRNMLDEWWLCQVKLRRANWPDLPRHSRGFLDDVMGKSPNVVLFLFFLSVVPHVEAPPDIELSVVPQSVISDVTGVVLEGEEEGGFCAKIT